MRKNFDKLAEMQDALSSLTESTITQVTVLCSHFDPVCIARNLVNVVEHRFCRLKVFVLLVQNLVHGKFAGEEFTKLLLRECLEFRLSVTVCAFVYACAKDGVFTFDQVCDIIEELSERTLEVHKLLWVWFGKELTELRADSCRKFAHPDIDLERACALRDDPFREFPLLQSLFDDKSEDLQIRTVGMDTNREFNVMNDLFESIVDLKTCTEGQGGRFTLLDVAAFFGSVKCFRHLLVNGEDLTMADNSMFGTLFSGSLEILQIIDQHRIPFKSSFVPAAIRCYQNDIAFWRMERESVPLQEIAIAASRSNNLGMFLYCLDQGFDVNSIISSVFGKDMRAVHWAASNRCKDVFELLMLYPSIKVSEPNIIGWRPIHWAVHCGDIEIVKMLLCRKDCVIDIQTNSVSLIFMGFCFCSFYILDKCCSEWNKRHC